MTKEPSLEAKYEAVVKAIIDAVPEIVTEHAGTHLTNGKPFILYRPITLEDVLRALRKKTIAVCNDSNGQEADMCLMIGSQVLWSKSCKWTLGKSLSEQDEACIDFLHSLLCQN